MTNPLTIRLIAAAAGLLLCFRGYSAFRLALGATGFVVGAYFAATHAAAFPPSPAWLAPSIVLAAGLISALLVVLAWKFGVVAIGAIGMVMLIQTLPVPLPIDPVVRLVVLAVAGLIGAVMARFLERFAVSLLTAALGAFLIVSTLADGPSWGRLPFPQHAPPLAARPGFYVLWCVLAVAGLFVQLRAGERKKRDSESS